MIFKILPHENRTFAGIYKYNCESKDPEHSISDERSIIGVYNSIATIGYSSPFVDELNYISSQNNRVKNATFHVTMSLSPQESNLPEETSLEIISKYLTEMGYNSQPYMVWKHTDTDNLHYHILTSRVDRFTHKKINHSNERYRSLLITDELNKEYDLSYNNSNEIATEHHTKETTTGQYNDLNAVIDKIFTNLKPSNFLQFKKLCAEEQIIVTKTKKGYVFFPYGTKKGIFASSLKCLKIQSIDKRLRSNRYKQNNKKRFIRQSIDLALKQSNNLDQYITAMSKSNIDVIISRNNVSINGLLYQYQNNEYKGSDLGKQYTWSNVNKILNSNHESKTSTRSKEINVTFTNEQMSSDVMQQIFNRIASTGGSAAKIKKKQEEEEQEEIDNHELLPLQ